MTVYILTFLQKRILQGYVHEACLSLDIDRPRISNIRAGFTGPPTALIAVCTKRSAPSRKGTAHASASVDANRVRRALSQYFKMGFHSWIMQCEQIVEASLMQWKSARADLRRQSWSTTLHSPDLNLLSSAPRYLSKEPYFFERKSLPNLPSESKKGAWDTHDPYAVEHIPTSKPRHFEPHLTGDDDRLDDSAFTSLQQPRPTTEQLARALGPDNEPHSTEIETIPCAGVRIPYGPLSGLMGWRLVVRRHREPEEKHSWWSGNTTAARRRRNSSAFPPPPALTEPSLSYPYYQQMSQNPLATASAVTLPSTYTMPGGDSASALQRRPNSDMVCMRQPESHPRAATLPRNAGSNPVHNSPLNNTPTAVAVNFILDTGLPYSIISRDTLLALGYTPSQIPELNPRSQLSSSRKCDKNEEPATVTLSVQGVRTQLQIARAGEASRLGVQFLRDAGASVFFPSNGDGVGPVLYAESACMFKDVPKTIHSVPWGHGKMTLPQKVRALFGLS
ncbi:unnamed protein product [Cyclocybe aegerita]|uniref:Uncharacterized protein n=1 Tax=Cyclocybe aegerita TaxID=1973307 RepID=A0A8S0WMB2_CYCAE|nr:unnamed protein product [Cyclocybe aegerita]